MNVNRVMIAGRLTREPKLRHIRSDLVVADFGVASNRTYKGRTEVLFIDVTAWGRIAENIAANLHRGNEIFIEGHLKLDQWERNGEKKSRIKVVVDLFQYVGPKTGGPVEYDDLPVAGPDEPPPDDLPF